MQSKGQNVGLLAFLGKKRLAQEKNHQQETQCKEKLARQMKAAHLERALQSRDRRLGQMKSQA